jgi:hypothetical protein
MEALFEKLFKVLTEPTQIVLLAWLLICHIREREDRAIADKLREVMFAQRETLSGMARTIEKIMDRISGGSR